MLAFTISFGSNNTNKLSPQEPKGLCTCASIRSNNTNKLSPQEPCDVLFAKFIVQIIQINLVLKNFDACFHNFFRFK